MFIFISKINIVPRYGISKKNIVDVEKLVQESVEQREERKRSSL